jgi:succinoglycan biosynthesis protein ExoM
LSKNRAHGISNRGVDLLPKNRHINVCICTFKRPRLLGGLLRALDTQETGGVFDYDILVVDNDRAGSARLVVDFEATRTKKAIRYYVEPEQNIALARNKAVENAHGDFVAFIDDDELPDSRWLLNMYRALMLFETAGVLGPVRPRYESPPPDWVIRGKFFDRPDYYSGYFLNWWLTRTGNCLLKRSLFKGREGRFLPEFGSGGEDRDFFMRMIYRGHVFVWCAEAPIYEMVPPDRWKIITMLRRALLRGKMTYQARKSYPSNLLGSFGAALFYSVGLPLLWTFSPVFGFDVFMKTLVRDCDHLGKIFALFGINPVRHRYIVSLAED